MVPRWFRPGSAMVPEPPPSEDHTFCGGSGWFRDGSTMVPHGFRDGSGAAAVGGPYVFPSHEDGGDLDGGDQTPLGDFCWIRGFCWDFVGISFLF